MFNNNSVNSAPKNDVNNIYFYQIAVKKFEKKLQRYKEMYGHLKNDILENEYEIESTQIEIKTIENELQCNNLKDKDYLSLQNKIQYYSQMMNYLMSDNLAVKNAKQKCEENINFTEDELENAKSWLNHLTQDRV